MAAGERVSALRSTVHTPDARDSERADQRLGQEFGGVREETTRRRLLSLTLPGWVVANLLPRVAEHCQPSSPGARPRGGPP
jgi:hypothetical protein